MALSGQVLASIFLMMQLGWAEEAGELAVAEASGLETHWLSADIIAVVLIGLGLIMAFSGKRFFRLFLGCSGFMAGGVLMHQLVSWADTAITIPYPFYVFVILCIIGGLLGAWLCYTMWEIGVLAAAGYGGYTLGVCIMALKEGSVIESYMTRSVFLAVCTVGAVVLAWFFDELAIIVASAVGGSMALVLGADIFLKWGLLYVVLAAINPTRFAPMPLNGHVYIELAAVLALAVCGMVVQFLGQKRGLGKGDRT